MPRVNYTTAKGLFQDTGAGVKITQEASSATTPAFSSTTLLVGRDAANVDPFSVSTTQLFPLGAKLLYGDRAYRYVFTGGTIAAGKLLASPAHIANHTNCLVINADAAVLDGVAYSHAVGSRAICIDTAGDTDLTEDQYAEGYLLVNDAQGEGQMLKIRTHKAHNHGVDPSVVIETYDPVTTTLVKNATQCSLIANPYKDVVTAPQAEVGAVVAASAIAMADDRYGWAVVSGPAAILADTTLVLGQRVVRTDGSGAGGVMADAGDDLTAVIGQVMGSGVVNTEYAAIWLNIE